MKVKTALERSKTGLKWSSPLVLVLAVLVIQYPSWLTLAPLLFVGFYWLGDLINVWSIRRKASQDPAYLDETIQ